jgi:hypothetical protein
MTIRYSNRTLTVFWTSELLQLLHPRQRVLLHSHLCGPEYDVHQQLAEVVGVLRIPVALSLVLDLNRLLRVLESIRAPFRAGKTR